MGTPKQEKLVKEITENYRNNKTQTLGKMLRNSGYKKSTSKQPSRIIRSKTIQDEISPFLKKLINHRNKIIKAMDKKDLNREQYKILSDALQKFNHDIQVLSGGKTENISATIKWEE